MKQLFKCFYILTFLITIVVADSKENNRNIQYMSSEIFYKELYNLGVYWDRQILDIETNCQSQYKVDPISFSIIKPIVFDNNQVHPIDGMWTFRFKFTRCNNFMIYNALIIARKDNLPKMVALVPGNTNCSPQLISDLYRGILVNLYAKYPSEKKCEREKFFDTQVTIAPKTVMEKGDEINMWEELWKIEYCGEKIDMNICLLQTQKNVGTTWVIGKCKNN